MKYFHDKPRPLWGPSKANAMRYIILFCLLVGATSVQAQPTIAETKREQQHRREFDEYMDAIRQNRNTPSTKVNAEPNKAIDELAEQFRRNAGKMTDAERAAAKARLDAEQQRRREAAAERRRAAEAREEAEFRQLLDRRWALENGREAGLRKNAALFQQEGFVSFEADYYAKLFTPFPDGTTVTSEDRRALILNGYRARKAFRRDFATASYDSLIRLCGNFAFATSTYFAATDSLLLRFPAEAPHIEALRAGAAALSCEGWPEGTNTINTRPGKSEAHLAARDGHLAYFKKAYPKYRNAILLLLGKSNTVENPLFLTAFRAERAGDTAAARYYWNEFLQIHYPADQSLPEKMRSALSYLGRIPGYFTSQPLSYYKDLAKAHSTQVISIIELFGRRFNNLRTTYLNDRNQRVMAVDPAGFESNGYARLVQRLADDGDASCANTYGIFLLYHGKTEQDRSSGYAYLNKAITLGSTWARVNLAIAAADRLPGAPDFAAQQQALKTFGDAAPRAQKLNLINVLISPEVPETNDPWFFSYAFELAKGMAAQGDSAVSAYLQSAENVFRFGTFTGQAKDLPWRDELYTGPVKNGRPHGRGTTVYTSRDGETRTGTGVFWGGSLTGDVEFVVRDKRGRKLNTYTNNITLKRFVDQQ